MLTTALTAYVSAAHALGGYNLGRFFLKKAVERRRERKAQAIRDAKVDDIVDDLSALRERLYSGRLDPVRAKAVRDMVMSALNEPVEAEPVK